MVRRMADGTKLTYKTVPLTAVTPHPKNVRQGDVGAICQSLEAHGQYRPIVVQASTGHILAGNHTWQAMNALGWKKVAVTYIDVDDDEALRILLVDNRANDLATYDDHGLLELLQQLASTKNHLAGTGFDGDDLDDLLAQLTPPSLDDLLDSHPMDDEAHEALWPSVRVKVPQRLFTWWNRVFAAQPGDNDVERMESVLLVLDPTGEFAPDTDASEDVDL